MYKCSADFNNNNSTTQSITLADNAEVVADAAIMEHDPHQHFGMSIKKEKFKQFLDHPVLINHLAWAAGTTSSTLSTDIIQLYKTSAPTFLIRKLQNLMFFKAKIRIKVVVQGQAQAYGQMVYAFFPNLLTPASVTEAKVAKRLTTRNLVNAKIVPHLVIDPSKTATYELELPICTPNGVYSFNTDISLGSYALERYIFNGLASGTAVAAASNVCMYMTLVDPEFDGLTITNMASSVAAKEMKYSEIAKGASNVSKSIGDNFPVLSPVTSLFSTVASGASSVLSAFGFSRPPAVVEQVFITNRTCDAYSQTDGVSTNIVMGPSQKQGEAIAPEYMSGSLQDMEIASIVKKRGLITLSASLAPAVAPNTLVNSWKVHPLAVRVPTTDQYEPTPIAGIAACHAGWRGDLTYTFEFVASVFHRATVLIAWDPYNLSVAPTVTEALATLETVTVNISGNTCVDVVIPYKQVDPMLRCRKFFQAGNSGSDPNGFNGRIHLFIINPVLSNGSIDGITYNVYISSENIKFMAPTPMLLNTFNAVMTMSLITNEVTKIQFGESGDGLAGYGFEPDVVSSVKDIMRRHNEYYLPVSAPSYEFAMVCQNNVAPRFYQASPVITTAVKNTFVGFLTSAYLGWRGSLSWSFYAFDNQADSNPWVQLGHHVAVAQSGEIQRQTKDFLKQEEAYAYTQPNFQVSSRGDVVVPRMLAWYFTPARYRWDSYMDTVQADFRFLDINVNNEADIMVAAGDDYVVGWFLGFPTQYIPP